MFRCDLHYGVVEGGHGDTGGQEAHAGAGHQVDLVGPDIVIQRRILGHFINHFYVDNETQSTLPGASPYGGPSQFNLSQSIYHRHFTFI